MLEDGALPGDQRRQMESIHRNALQLLARVEDLLAAARTDGGASRVAPSNLDLAGLVRKAAAHFTELAADHGVRLTVETPEEARALVDGPKAERILLNLLSNAFKFTERGGVVRVVLASAGDGPHQGFAITVEDDGPGVPEDARDLVFDRFYQVEGGSHRPVGGSGLGLSIARDLAELQGGTIGVDRSPLGGARFRVVLPDTGRAGSPAPASERPGEGPGSGLLPEALSVAGTEAPEPTEWRDDDRRHRVLVVEDHDDMRAHLGRVLGEDFACVCLSNGRDALELMAESMPDLLVTDLMMPGMTGRELVEGLRELENGQDVPVLVLTARSEPSLPAQLLRSGVQDFLTKPVRADELLARAHNLASGAVAMAVLRRALGETGSDLPALSSEIAQRKQRLESLVHEKETLLQELHHRVKGNLQTVASLLSLQLRSLDQEAARDALEDSRSRIRAIALLHERLYQDGGGVASVEVGGYLKGLVAEVTRAFAAGDGNVRIDVRADEIHLDVERAVACGLAAHELVVNALEHGLEGDGPAKVALSLDREGEDVALTVEDEGGGLPDEVPRTGLGLKLVEALTRQLRGTLDMQNTPGLRCRIRFPLEVPGAREAGR